MTAPQDTVFLLDVDNTLKIVLKNTGKQMYERVIGTKKELDEHAALMVKFPAMEHNETYMAHVSVPDLIDGQVEDNFTTCIFSDVRLLLEPSAP